MLLIVGLLGLGWAASASPASAPPLAADVAVLGRLPSIEHVAISPDGRRLAFVTTGTGDERIVAVVSVADGQVSATARAGDTKLRAVRWLDDDHVLLAASNASAALGLRNGWGEWTMLHVFDLRTKKVRQLLTGMTEKTMNVAAPDPMVRRIDGKTVVFAETLHASGSRLKAALVSIDLESGRENVVARGDLDTEGWLVDPGGEIAAEMRYDEDGQEWAVRLRRDGDTDEVASGKAAFGGGEVLGFDPDGARVWVSLPKDDVAVTAGPLTEGSDGAWNVSRVKDLDDVVRDPLTDRILAVVMDTDVPTYAFLDPTLQARWDRIVRSYDGERVSLVSMSADQTRLVVLVDGPSTGYAYELVDTASGEARPIGAVYKGMPARGVVGGVSYQAGDGLGIPGYVTLPPGRPRKNLPLIVLPHGGPASHDDGSFDWFAQALAARGYAVLQPNFRGSTISTAHLRAGFGQWGRKMQTDLSDGVRHLAGRGIIDPSRVCIVGMSYGGYAALAGVTLDPGVYRCAVSVAGVSGLRTMRDWVEEHRAESVRRYWNNFWGVSDSDEKALDALSPVAYASRVTVPVMLIHGRDDAVVPVDQSRRMARALESQNKPVELVALDGEDHWLSRSATRLATLAQALAFLERHNPPDGAGPSSVGSE
jgi:dipeptidyl aminopeptidase/acylaminoacyl peptidase